MNDGVAVVAALNAVAVLVVAADDDVAADDNVAIVAALNDIAVVAAQ